MHSFYPVQSLKYCGKSYPCVHIIIYQAGDGLDQDGSGCKPLLLHYKHLVHSDYVTKYFSVVSSHVLTLECEVMRNLIFKELVHMMACAFCWYFI